MTPAVDELRSEGWFVDSLKAENYFEADYCTMKASTLRDLFLNADIKDISSTVLSDKLDKRKGELNGPLVLQLSSWRNISYPKIPDHTENDGICKIMLTDGFTSVPCLQIDTSLPINGNTSYGTKIQLNGNITYECGHLILNSKNCNVFGGNVEKLIEKWKIGKMGSTKNVEKGPNYVKFIPYSEKKNSCLDVKMKNLDLNSNGDKKKVRNEKSKENKTTERRPDKIDHVCAFANPPAQFDQSQPFSYYSGVSDRNNESASRANANKNVHENKRNDIVEKKHQLPATSRQKSLDSSSDAPRQQFDPPVSREFRRPPGTNTNLRQIQPQQSKTKQFPSNPRELHSHSSEVQPPNQRRLNSSNSQGNTLRFQPSAPPPGFQNNAARVQFQPPIASEFQPPRNNFPHIRHQFQPPNNLHFQSSGHRHDFHQDDQCFPNHHNSVGQSYPYNYSNPPPQEDNKRDFFFNNSRNACPQQQFVESQQNERSAQNVRRNEVSNSDNQNREQYTRSGGPPNRRGSGGQQRRFVNANYRRNQMGQ